MKKINFLFLFLFLFLKTNAQGYDYFGIREITFNNLKYSLVTTDQKSKFLYVQDYIMEDESIEEPSHILSIYYFNRDIDAKYAAMSKSKELEIRKNTDKYCFFDTTENPNGTEFIIDFFTSNISKNKEENLQKEEISEYNIYRFKNIKKGNKRMLAIIAYKEKSTGNPKYLMKNISKKKKYTFGSIN